MDNFSNITKLFANVVKYTPEEIRSMSRYEEADAEFRMITGKGLEELKSMFLAGYHMEPPEPPVSLVEEQPEIGEWILCSEKLPEENQNVIVCFAHGTVTELAFYNGFFHGVYNYDEKVIIAWQPLPEPYKGQDS